MQLHHQHKKYIGNEGNVLFNDALNTFYLRLSTHFIYGYMASVKKNSYHIKSFRTTVK